MNVSLLQHIFQHSCFFTSQAQACGKHKQQIMLLLLRQFVEGFPVYCHQTWHEKAPELLQGSFLQPKPKVVDKHIWSLSLDKKLCSVGVIDF